MAKGKKINPSHHQPKIKADLKLLRRILSGIEQDENGCWVWQKYKDAHGYGQIHYSGRAHWVHRVTYSIFKRSIAEGDEIDHVCRNHSCCNPAHLKRVKPKVNRTQRWRKPSNQDLPPF